MQKRTLPSSLLITAALALPSMAIAAPVNTDPANINDPVNTNEVTPVDQRALPVDNTLQAELEGPDGELLATQPGAVETDEEIAIAADVESDDADMEMDAEAVTTDNTPEAIKAVALEPAQTTPDQVNTQPLNKQHSDANYQPLLKGEAHSGDVTPADQRESAVPITLQEKKKDKRGELLATQPADVELGETRRIVVR